MGVALRITRSAGFALLAAALMATSTMFLFVSQAAAAVPSQEAGVRCGDTTMTLEKDGAVVFELPAQAGQKFALDPEATMTLRVKNVPSQGSVDLFVRLPFGQSVKREFSWSGLVAGSEHVETFGPADYGKYVNLVRGAYPLEVDMFVGDSVLCTVPFEARVGEAGIRGPVATTAAVATGVAAVGTVAVAGWAAATTAASNAASSAASGAMTPEATLKIAVARRRQRGWRRYFPLPSLKKTVVGSMLGTITGILISLTLQQGGFEALTSFTMIRNMVVGAFSAVGFGVAWGSVLGFIRKPLPEGEAEGPGKGGPPSIARSG